MKWKSAANIDTKPAVYTHQWTWTTSTQVWEGGVQWSRGAWKSSDNINSVRYPDYSRLDIQWISRFYMQNWNINVYIALMNLFNTKNVFYYEYRSDGTREAVYQFAFFPCWGHRGRILKTLFD